MFWFYICSCLGLVAIFYGLAEKTIPASFLLFIIGTLTSILYIIMRVSIFISEFDKPTLIITGKSPIQDNDIFIMSKSFCDIYSNLKI